MNGFAALTVAWVIAATMVLFIIDDHFRADLIQRGLAEYCATDGRFAFKGECP